MSAAGCSTVPAARTGRMVNGPVPVAKMGRVGANALDFAAPGPSARGVPMPRCE
jgi:hypothetical protein